MNPASFWQEQYRIVPSQLQLLPKIHSVVTAFNTNIDAVIKLKGSQIAELAAAVNIDNASASLPSRISTPQDVVRGIIRCFTLGIAEEWLAEDAQIVTWMMQNLGYDRLQMGGQSGIISNVMALLGVNKVYVHTNSHPALQSQQFLDMDNLLAIDENGSWQKASAVSRNDDPLIHWIIEFDKDDVLPLNGKNYVCPKANRFIATYDPANMNLQINPDFINKINQQGFNYLILSGYHNLTAHNRGMELIEENISLLRSWKQKWPHGIIHLELASTQDKIIRLAIINKIAPLVDSVGLNDRETLDALEVADPELYHDLSKGKPTSVQLLQALYCLKEKLKTPRLQLHMFGLYITLQDSDFSLSPRQNKNGMMLAATVAASKAGIGQLANTADLLWAHGQDVSSVGLAELENLARFIGDNNLMLSGIGKYRGYDIIAVPTILIDKPKTLVGMGDTISSVSLVGAG